jgi:ribosomal protein S25
MVDPCTCNLVFITSKGVVRYALKPEKLLQQSYEGKKKWKSQHAKDKTLFLLCRQNAEMNKIEKEIYITPG